MAVYIVALDSGTHADASAAEGKGCEARDMLREE